MKISIKLLLVLIPVLLAGKISIVKDIESSIVDIRNDSNYTISVSIDVGSFDLETNEALLLKCSKDETKYISIKQKINHDFYVDCNSKISITDD